MTKIDLAYFAGVIDSDGTIGIKRSTYAMRRRGDAGQPVFSERVCVRQVEPQAVDALHAAFGGYRHAAKSYASRGRTLHGWQVTDQKAAKCLRALLPFLRIKRAQAETCLALRSVKERSKVARVAKGRGHMGSAPRRADLSAEMEALCAHAHDLNRVGV